MTERVTQCRKAEGGIMIFEGASAEVRRQLLEKHNRLRGNKSSDDIRLVLLLLGGVMGGAAGAGKVSAFADYGFSGSHIPFDDVIGLSSGTPIAACFLDGNPWRGATIYSEECTTRNFLAPFGRWRNPCDIGYLDSVFRGATGKRIDVERVLRSRSKFHIAVTEYDTGLPRYVVPTDEEELFTAIKASVAMPGLYSDAIYIDGVRYVDGILGDPFPIEWIIQKFNPTSVFVIGNTPRPTFESRLSLGTRVERLLFQTCWRRRVSSSLRRALVERLERFNESLRFARTQPVPIFIAWGDQQMSLFERSSEKLSAVTSYARKRMHDWLEGRD